MQDYVLPSNNCSEITHGTCKMSCCFVPCPLTTKQGEDFLSLDNGEKNFQLFP